MLNIFPKWRIAWLTARRAGWRRSLARLRRILFLRWLNPRFATRLYPPRAIHPPRIDNLADLIPVAMRVPSPIWNGEITLLNTPAFKMQPPIDWNANPLSHTLWAFRLHEFGWAWQLVQLAIRGHTDSLDTLAEIIRDYIEHVRFACGIAGEPYTISRRLVVFSVAWHVLRSVISRSGATRNLDAKPRFLAALEMTQETGFLPYFVSHIDQMARLLCNHIEHDLDNNHVIANAKALAFVGVLMGQAELARFGFDLLWRQLRLQVRADGMHLENSSSYHWQVLCDALDCVRLARRFHFPAPNDIMPCLRKMANVVRVLRRPDGSLPLLNDSVDEDFANIDSVLADVDLTPQSLSDSDIICFSHSGYAILQNDETKVLFDAGALGPAFCPGHGHADALSFELWARNRLLIVDPGVYQYQAGEWRDYFRSTVAHSTIVVDGLDQSELSDSFRVGAMAEARFTRIESEHALVAGTHTGYRRLRQPVTHTRTLTLISSQELQIEDRLTGVGEHFIDVCFHLAPGARVETGDQSARVFFDDVQLQVQFDRASFQVAASNGWYSPTWYTKLFAPVLHYYGRGTMPLTITTTLEIC